MSWLDFTELAKAHGEALAKAIFKAYCEDFVVEEVLGITPTEEGEHELLWVEKTGQNTAWVAKQLAAYAGISQRQVSYCGLKDRQAVTRQWFSLHLPGKQGPDWQQLNIDGVNIKQVVRHQRKLARGCHAGNRFVIRLRECQVDENHLTERMSRIQAQGVPNYFGAQRFGHGNNNLTRANQWFAGEWRPKKNQQDIYWSAARAYVFNKVLNFRVENNLWNELITGDVLQFNDSNTLILPDKIDDTAKQKWQQAELIATAPLWGKGRLLSQLQVAEIETKLAKEEGLLTEGLVSGGVAMARRPLVVYPQQLAWQQQQDSIEVSFYLPKGAYATAVVRELVDW
ncbi:tRNA pseudouridine(13) synthase TruD [Endozoicomonas sp. SM1973]|uniref:tRNA pseudouridine synthase D n=1 Tax=Spartinivicinus marinus TaxID=2994442 RepID=A0A853I1M2_9GAMM|nr:tRNA pseudouridine(13) synthase TruD [Spartinivicinus marinus]NYZ65342.1 tRNA pseudouridine(13) synthase TruD [Spartinivicinus marinus]